MKIVFEFFGGFGNSFGAGDFGFLISSRGVVFGSFGGSRKDSSERSRVRAQAGRFNEALVALDGFGRIVETGFEVEEILFGVAFDSGENLPDDEDENKQTNYDSADFEDVIFENARKFRGFFWAVACGNLIQIGLIIHKLIIT